MFRQFYYSWGALTVVDMPVDPAVKRLIWYLIAGSRGGINRGRIIGLLRERPYNANQLSEKAKLDYKSVQHHISVLKKNNVIDSEGEKYGVLYFLTPYFELHLDTFDEIWRKIGKTD
jgi:DNA-binding transcriptional ArsR family regulator